MLLVLRNCFIEYSYTYNNRDFKQLAKKYGYSDKCKISNYIRFYENRDLIKSVVTSDNISYKKAMKVLRELKQKEKGKLEGNNWR
jgi:hypothetical protein